MRASGARDPARGSRMPRVVPARQPSLPTSLPTSCPRKRLLNGLRWSQSVWPDWPRARFRRGFGRTDLDEPRRPTTLLNRLITRRSQVQILPPLPSLKPCIMRGFVFLKRLRNQPTSGQPTSGANPPTCRRTGDNRAAHTEPETIGRKWLVVARSERPEARVLTTPT